MHRRVHHMNRATAGAVLAVVLIFFAVVVVAGLAFIGLAAAENVLAITHTLPAKALYLAEAGCEWGKAWLKAQSTPPAGTQPILLGETALGDGSYTVTVVPDIGNLSNYIKHYTIVGLGAVKTPGGPKVRASKTLTVAMRTESFARYAYLTDNERSVNGQTVWFVSADRITGPAHSNSQFHISGSPTFEGLVSSTASSFDFYRGGPPLDNPSFAEGYQLNASPRDFAALQNLARIESAATAGGLKISATAAEIRFNADGTMTYRQKKSSWGSWQTRALPGNGVIYVEGDAMVYGTLKGQVTLAVQQDKSIQIPGDLRYSKDPGDPECTDMLGLVAGQGVVVTKTSPEGANLTIHAAIMALGTHFTVQDYATIPKMGTLTVYGGIIQKNRGPVGTFSSATGQIVTGYTKNYIYDTRLKNRCPPYFPTTGRYEQYAWQESATIFGR